MLTEKQLQRTTIDELGNMSIETITVIMRDGVEIARTNHRRVIAAGDNVTAENAETKALAAVAHTPERIAARTERARQANEATV